MKHNLNVSLLIILLLTACLMLSACNAPNGGKPAAATETPVTANETQGQEDETMIQNRSENGDNSGDGMIHNNSGTTPAPENEEEQDMIINKNRSAVDLPKSASLSFRTSAALTGTHAQTKNDSDIMIVNDHKITYQEQPSIITKSVPSGTLGPLSYIPPQSLSNGQSIAFTPGATSAVIQGYVPAGGYLSYNFYAFANQNFLVLLSSDSGTSVLGLSDVYGNVFLEPGQGKTSYSMYLPRTATYYLNIYSGGYSENVTLQIFIPARVTIPIGKTSVSMSGSLAPYSVVSYTAYMYAGQTARIDDYSGPQPNSFLRISGLQTGQVYMDYTSYSPSWYSVVPVTQDYLIEVITMDQTSNYRLTVDVR